MKRRLITAAAGHVAKKSGAYLAGKAAGYLAKNVAKRLARRAIEKWKSKSKHRRRTKSGSNKGIGKRVQVSQHNDLSTRNIGFCYMGGKRKIRKGLVSKSSFRNVNQWVIEGPQGRQVVDYPEVILTKDIIIGTTSANRVERGKLPINLTTMTLDNATANTTITNVANANYADAFYLRHVKGHLNLISMSTVPQEVTCYFVTPRKTDMLLNPIDTWNNIASQKSYNKTFATEPAVVGTAAATYGTSTYYHFGASPWELPEFKSLWKTVKQFKIILQPGDQHNVAYKFIYNRKFSMLDYNQHPDTHFIKDVTIFPLIIVRAGLIGLHQSDDYSVSEVAPGETKVGVYHNHEYVTSAIPASRFSMDLLYPGAIASDVLDFRRQIDDTDHVITPDES